MKLVTLLKDFSIQIVRKITVCSKIMLIHQETTTATMHLFLLKTFYAKSHPFKPSSENHHTNVFVSALVPQNLSLGYSTRSDTNGLLHKIFT